MTGDEIYICGENSTLPANFVGCGKPINPFVEHVYRCTDCDVPFHKECAKKHFADEKTPELTAFLNKEQP